MERCQRRHAQAGKSAVRAHVTECFAAFAKLWRDIFKKRRVRHSIKERAALSIALRQCEYCAISASITAASSGVLRARDLAGRTRTRFVTRVRIRRRMRLCGG